MVVDLRVSQLLYEIRFDSNFYRKIKGVELVVVEEKASLSLSTRYGQIGSL
jgi:hypothetical protein